MAREEGETKFVNRKLLRHTVGYFGASFRRGPRPPIIAVAALL